MNNRMVWTPPTSLHAPIPPKGYSYRWVRLETIKLRKIRKKFNFSLVRLIKLKKKNYPSIHIKNFGRCVGVAGLVLAKIKNIRIKNK